jgi:hypothetical protein
MIILKNRTDAATDWYVYHASSGAGNFLKLNTTDANSASTTVWNNTAPTSSVFSLGVSASNTSAKNYVAYCWSEIASFSQFGSYTGNGSTDGPFIYTGFRPAFILIKNFATGNWCLFDDKRLGYNGDSASKELYPNLALAEGTSNGPDQLSNGFKFRDTYADVNASGATYIYAAFAENPFKYANAR